MRLIITKRILYVLLIQLVVFGFSVLVNLTPASAANSKPSIPAGCPGSSQAGLVDPFPAGICDKNNPPGCPGSTHKHKKLVGKAASKCKYANPVKKAVDKAKAKAEAKAKAKAKAKKSDPLKYDEDSAVKCEEDDCDLIAKYVNPAIDLFSLAFGLIAVISIIAGAIQYSASQGDPQKAAAAKSRISNTILAIIAYLFLFAFLQFLIPGGAFR